MKETFLTTYSFVYEQTVDTETGEILTEKSFIVAEIFLDKELNLPS